MSLGLLKCYSSSLKLILGLSNNKSLLCSPEPLSSYELQPCNLAFVIPVHPNNETLVVPRSEILLKFTETKVVVYSTF
jgi:hypothetical protein